MASQCGSRPSDTDSINIRSGDTTHAKSRQRSEAYDELRLFPPNKWCVQFCAAAIYEYMLISEIHFF